MPAGTERRAAEMGYPGAYEAVGELYRDGLGVEQDCEKAAEQDFITDSEWILYPLCG